MSPIVPVVVMDEREAGNVTAADEVLSGTDISSGAVLFDARS